MIVFQSDRFQLDLGSFGVSINEENDIFSDNISKSFSLPFVVPGTDEFLIELGMPTLDNIVNLDMQVPGRLLLADKHFPSTLFLGQTYKNNIECRVVFGSSDLPIYAVALKNLPWKPQLVGNVLQFAKTRVNKSWPEAAYAFPMVRKDKLDNSDGYEQFGGFLNYYKAGEYLENYIDTTGDEDVYVNQNVMVPFPYLLEIVKFGFKTAGKDVVGEVLENEDLRKALYIPKGFLERMDGSQYSAFSFSTRTSAADNGRYGGLMNVYTKEFVPQVPGGYKLKFKLNLDPVLAKIFDLSIYRKNALSNERTRLRHFFSFDNRVQLEEELEVEVTSLDILDPIVVELQLKYTDRSIADFNNFEIEFSDGKLNIFPTNFSLSNFMPDMTFGEYINLLKNWLNIKVDIQEKVVVLSFLEKEIFNSPIEDHSHLEDADKRRTSNANRFYKLSYSNDEKLFYTKDGQIYSDLDDEGHDVVKIEMNVQPAVVERSRNITTAVAPEQKSKLDFCLYNGMQNGLPVCPMNLSRNLSLQTVFDRWWMTWLRFRVRSFTFKDSFECSPWERINIDELSRKYNEIHILKKLTRKYKSENIMRVDVESETF